VMYNDGNGLYPTSTNFPTGQTPRYVHGADFDGDGDIDLCTPDYSGMTETVLQNDGAGSFTILAQYPIQTPALAMVRSQRIHLLGSENNLVAGHLQI